MSNGTKRRSRLDRVSALEMPPGKFLSVLRQIRQREVIWRLALAVVAAIALWTVNAAWYPPFRYHFGDVSNRDLLASVTFREPNPAATEDARQKAREEARFVYA